MSVQNYRNADPFFARTWGQLVDRATSHTLRLEPGEVTTDGVGTWTPDGEPADLPADFTDLYLEPVALAESPAPSASKKAATATSSEDVPAPPAHQD